MALFLADISSYEHGLTVAALTDCVGILAKVTEGTYYADADYDLWRRQAAAAGKVFVAYHFVRADQDPDAQAAWIAAHIGDASLPLMLDVETEGTSKPTIAQVLALADRCVARGLRPKLAYIPRWYWGQIGSPDLTGLWTRGIGLVSSSYPGGAGTPAQLYPGDTAGGWLSYGGMAPMLWQFTDQAADGGQLMDMNAYRGSREQLLAFLGGLAPTPTGGTTMADGTIPGSIASQDPDLPQIGGMFPAGAPFDSPTALIWADERAAAANIHARQARDAVAALQQTVSADDGSAAAHLQQVADSIDALAAMVHGFGSVLAGLQVGGLDVKALAVALAPELSAHLTLTVGVK